MLGVEDGDWSGSSVLQQLGSSLTANAYPAGTNEFSFGERRQGPPGVLTPLSQYIAPRALWPLGLVVGSGGRS
jgi:hypothetical protein